MASHDRREFDKYLKFLTYKVVQSVVQSRQGRKIKTKSAPHGNEWFNVTIQDDKQVSSQLKHSLEGRLPQQGSPVCVEISMETLEGESLVLEVWSVSINYSARDIGVSVPHLLYPRLSLMLKSLTSLSRTTPAYRLSRQQEDNLKFNYRIFCANTVEDSKMNDSSCKHINFAKAACPYGTISLSLSYRQTIAFPDRVSAKVSVLEDEKLPRLHTEGVECESLSEKSMTFPFASTEPATGIKEYSPSLQQPFSAILPRPLADNSLTSMSLNSTPRQDSGNSVVSSEVVSRENSSGSDPPPKESDGFIMVNIGEIRPTFAGEPGDGVCDFLQSEKDMPELDLFSSEQSTDVYTAMKIIGDKIE